MHRIGKQGGCYLWYCLFNAESRVLICQLSTVFDCDCQRGRLLEVSDGLDQRTIARPAADSPATLSVDTLQLHSSDSGR